MSSYLSIQLNNFSFNKNDENLLIDSGFFRIKRKSKHYLVTTHNFLPIKNQILLNEQKLKICINCTWNELLILKGEDITINKEIKTFGKISSRLAPVGTILFVKGKKVMVNGYSYSDSFFIPGYPKAVYIRIKVSDPKSYASGMPIYCSHNKLHGIVSYSDSSYIYCLPSYYLLKTFEMENKFSVPVVDNKIIKVNRHHVKDDMIFNHYLGVNMPISSFLFLEKDRELEVYYDGNDEPKKVNYIPSYEKLILNKRNLVDSSDGFYLLTTSALHLIRKIYPKYAMPLYKSLSDNPNLKFKVDKNYLIIH